jgi:probable O-glycosylation ligase (exosortase A-associated)
VRDLAFIGFLVGLLGMGLRKPFLFTLAYVYVDTVSPQRLSYYLLNSIQLSMIVAVLAIGGWLIADARRGFGLAPRQGLMLALLAYAGWTTFSADFPVDALVKWDWVWKALAFAIFLPLTLQTRLRIEAVALFLTLSAAAIIIVGGIKTILSGGGYGVLNLMVDNNSGLYESSTISTIAIALIPIILWLMRHTTVFPRDWRTKIFCAGLIFACLLMPIGTEARTGLVCIGVLGILMLRDVRRRFLYMGAAGFLAVAAIPFLPQSFTQRMETIQGYQGDESANTRLAVWGWTWNYVLDHPFGGGFDAYRQNRIHVPVIATEEVGGVTVVQARMGVDEGRAYHSAYFEMLGEQGFPGLLLFLIIHVTGLVRMEIIRRRYRAAADGDEWISPLATALQHFQIIYLVGAVFVGIAFQPFVWLMLGLQVGFDSWLGRRRRTEIRAGRGFGSPLPA